MNGRQTMDENPYPGINAHLNSFLQTPDSKGDFPHWQNFHTQHIAHMVEVLNALLPDHYVVLNDASLQKPSENSTGTDMRAVTIRQATPEKFAGAVIVRIELISPQTKSEEAGTFTEPYNTDRFNTLIDGEVLVEMDYLHEAPSIVREMPKYPENPFAHPSTILIHDMRPFSESGKSYVYGFHPDSPLPHLILRLSEQERIAFDLNAVYQHTFRIGRWADLLNYNDLPARFGTYSTDDQIRIREIMKK